MKEDCLGDFLFDILGWCTMIRRLEWIGMDWIVLKFYLFGGIGIACEFRHFSIAIWQLMAKEHLDTQSIKMSEYDISMYILQCSQQYPNMK